MNATNLNHTLTVALYTEGTYPQAHGGVSVWVNQLVQGLSDHSFKIQAISGLPFLKPALTIPSNVSFEQIPLWGPAPFGPARPTPERRRQITEAYDLLIQGLCLLDLTLFEKALSTFSKLGAEGGFTSILDTPQISKRTLERWSTLSQQLKKSRAPSDARLPVPTVADALDVQVWLEHSLRPLGTPAPQADIGHAVSNGFAGLLALNGYWTYGTPFILTEHGVYLRERYLEFRRSTYTLAFKGMLLRFYRLLCSLAYKRASLVLPGSHYNRRWEERLGAAPEKIQCVYNGIDPNVFPPADQEPSESVVSWVGRIDPLKDLETLIRAFDLVRRRNPQAKLRLFGGTPAGNEGYLTHCQSVSNQLHLEGNVTFEGRIDDITDAYRAGQIVALTSVSEGFPYTVIEAMAMGRPPVATRVGGVPEAVGNAGIIVRPRDAMGVASALIRLLEDAPLRAKMGKAARERVMELFTLDGCLNAYRQAYPAVLAGREP